MAPIQVKNRSQPGPRSTLSGSIDGRHKYNVPASLTYVVTGLATQMHAGPSTRRAPSVSPERK